MTYNVDAIYSSLENRILREEEREHGSISEVYFIEISEISLAQNTPCSRDTDRGSLRYLK